jgi:hypothetical protein
VRPSALASPDDFNGTAVWHRIADTVGQLTNRTPPRTAPLTTGNIIPQPNRPVRLPFSRVEVYS